MTRNSGRMPSSRKRKRPNSGPQERCQRSASSQSSSDDNRSGGRGCGRVIATFSATTSKGQLPQAALAIASSMASDLRPEHKLPSKDVLVSPNPNFLTILRTVGADKAILTAREVLSYLIKYISSRQLYDATDPKKVYVKNDPLGKVFSVDMFTIKDARKLLFENMTVVNRGSGFTLVHQQFQEGQLPDILLPSNQSSLEKPPSTITKPPSTPMEGTDGNSDQLPKYSRNPLVPIGLDAHDPPAPTPTPTPPVAESVAPRQYAPNPLSSMAISMDSAEDVKTETANVANLFRSVSLDVDPCQEGPSTAPSIPDSPTRSRQSKPDGKRTTKTRQPSESSDSKPKTPSKSPPSQSDASESGAAREWVSLHYHPGEDTKSLSSERPSVAVSVESRCLNSLLPKTPSKSPPSQSDASESGAAREWVSLHYHPGEDTKSLSSERPSVADYETVVVADSSDDLWFVEQEVSEFEIEYSVGDSSEGFQSNGSDDSSEPDEMQVFEVEPDDSSDSRWADDSSSTDTEISDQDKWDCFECQNRNPPVDRYCNRCWALRKGWLPDEQRMTLRERLINQAKLLRRTNSAPAGNMAAVHGARQHLQLTEANLQRHNTCQEEAMDTAAPIIRPGCAETHCYPGDNVIYPSNQCSAAGGVATLAPPEFCDSAHIAMTGGQYNSGLEAIPDDQEVMEDCGTIYNPHPQSQGTDFVDGNKDEHGRQHKTGDENGGGGGGAEGGPPSSQNTRGMGGAGYPGCNSGQGGVMDSSPKHSFGQATFGQPGFGQTTFGHNPVVNNSPPSETSPRIFGQDLEGYSPSAGPKPGGVLHQGHFRSSLSVTSNDSRHATCSQNTLSPESELDDEKTTNLVDDPIARKRMKMDTHRQDSGIGLSQEFPERPKMSPQVCNRNYVHTHADPPPLARHRHSSTSELDMIGSQESVPANQNQTGAIESNDAGPSTSGDGQTRQPDICGFCFKRPKNASIIHGKTGHQVCCYQCAKKLRRRGKPCPICRQSIQAVIKNFLV